jgi:hypothetical protein
MLACENYVNLGGVTLQWFLVLMDILMEEENFNTLYSIASLTNMKIIKPELQVANPVIFLYPADLKPLKIHCR